MADRKLLYINADGYAQEHSESGDSIKALSFKTSTKELTDAKLATLIDGATNSTAHNHDSYYFQESEFLNASAGSGDAGKPVKLDADGNIDATMINDADIDHGSIGGLSDDDHSQYILVAGTRAFTGKQSYNSHPSFSADTEIVDKKYVDDQIASNLQGLEWQESALDYIVDNTVAPPTEVLGDRYILSHDGGAPHANWDGASAGDIVEFNGTSWVAVTPTTGTFISADDEPSVVYYWGGSSWSAKAWENTTASTGLTKVGNDIRIDASAAGDGLGFLAGVLSVNVTGALEISADTIQVKADGINDTHIDFGTGTNQVSAVDLPIADAGNYFATDNVEAALQFLGNAVTERGVKYTASGAINKGDLVYISGNNSVSKYSNIQVVQAVVGAAAATVADTEEVLVLANDTVLTSVLSGATAGTRYYWTGSGYTANLGSFSTDEYIWLGGVAKNGTDVAVEVQFIKVQA